MRTPSTRTGSDQERDVRAGRAGPAAHDHDHDPARPDPRSVLGNRSTRTLLAQPKLMVGTSDDPLEIEADRVATEVVRKMSAAAPATGAVDHHCGEACAVHSPAPGVARTIRRHAGHGDHDHRCGDACAVHGTTAGMARTIRRHAGHDHHDHESTPIGAAGGEVRAADEAAVKRARGGGAALPADFRARIEPIMGADFSGVRVHTGPEATALNRSFGASAFTVGSDIFFRDRLPDVATSQGAHLLTHELTHTVQQGAAGSVSRCRCGSTEPHVQRHSSFEHLMLGNVDPVDLAKVGAWEDAIKQTVPTRTGVGKKVLGSGGGERVASVDVVLGNQTIHIAKKDILHVLLQEMIRLKKWQRNEPKESSAAQANEHGRALVNIGNDPEYEVVTIMLPQGIPCTYGEMNTLADYFGSVEVLRAANAKQVWQLLQSVRDETWMFLAKTFDKVAASLTKEERADADIDRIGDELFDEILMPDLLDGGGFEGAMAARVSGMAGQIELLGGIQGTGAKGETNKYTPSLGRNACHFVPESWHAWAANHKKARALALDARTARTHSLTIQQRRATETDPVEQGKLDRTFETLKMISADKANEALMTNGFGDHYLQDSYAAGHMINKTQIMQFYIEFIDKNNEWDYFKDANWRKVQNIAYGQDLAPAQQYDQARVEGVRTGPGTSKAMDPQSVENRSDGTWQTNFVELGLKVPPSLASPAASLTRTILSWLQDQARAGKGTAKGSVIEAALRPALPRDIRMAVGDLVLDGVLLTSDDVSTRGKQMADMRDSRSAAGGGLAGTGAKGAGEQLERAKFLKATFRLRDELKPAKAKKGAPVAAAKTEAELQEGFQALTYNDYTEFITSAFLQKSTNALHDTFCKNGLTVADGGGNNIGRVYGDDAMFSANSSMGVAYSGTTAQMSRDAIVNIINTGQDGGNSEQQIVSRFPRTVRADVYDDKGKVVTQGVSMGIEAWHNSANPGGLKGEAFRWIFPSMSWGITQKMAPGAKGELGKFFTAPAPHNPF